MKRVDRHNTMQLNGSEVRDMLTRVKQAACMERLQV